MKSFENLVEFYNTEQYTISNELPVFDPVFFDKAHEFLSIEFPYCTILPHTFMVNHVQVSGLLVKTPENRVASLVVLTASTSLKDSIVIKASAYNHMAQRYNINAARILSLHVNKPYTIDNNEPFFVMTDVTLQSAKINLRVAQAIRGLALASPTEITQDNNLASNQLPKPFKAKLKAFFNENPNAKMGDVPYALLNPTQRIVYKGHTTKQVQFNRHGIYNELNSLVDFNKPVYFLDFESVQFLVPTWEGVRPYDQVGFQYSLHKVHKGNLTQTEFVELTNDPRRDMAKRLIRETKAQGAILTYNVSFERRIVVSLAELFDDLSTELHAIADRLVDLFPLFKKHFYNHKQMGSWSLKAVLPSVLGFNPYADLDGACNGEDAAKLYLQVSLGMTDAVSARQSLSQYCTLDTLALYKLVRFIQKAKPKKAMAIATACAESTCHKGVGNFTVTPIASLLMKNVLARQSALPLAS